MSLEFWQDQKNFVDHFWWYVHFNNVNPSNPRTSDIFLLVYVLFSFFPQCLSFQPTDHSLVWLIIFNYCIIFGAVENEIAFLISLMVCCYYDFFSMLILYPANILNLFANSNKYLSEYLRISIYNILSSTNGDNFTSPFPIWMPFMSLSCLMCSYIALHEMARMDILVRSLILKKKLSDFHLWVWRYLWACNV